MASFIRPALSFNNTPLTEGVQLNNRRCAAPALNKATNGQQTQGVRRSAFLNVPEHGGECSKTLNTPQVPEQGAESGPGFDPSRPLPRPQLFFCRRPGGPRHQPV
jgi:hypothetical protein